MSHIISLQPDVSRFLDSLDENLVTIVKDTPASILRDPKKLEYQTSVILHANQPVYLEKYAYLYLKRRFGIENLHVRHEHLTHDKKILPYICSDYHFEFDFSDKYIPFMKSILSNQSILSDKPFIFVLKNLHNANKSSQMALTRMIDTAANTKFIFTCSRLSFVENPIKSRSLMVNISFEIAKLHDFTLRFTGRNMTCDEFRETYAFHDYNYIVMLCELVTKNTSKFDTALKTLLTKLVKPKNNLSLILDIREFCYRAFHLNIPFSHICKRIIENFAHHDKIHDMVQLLSKEEHATKITSKDLLIYESTFIRISMIVSS